jgi:hypothetical protein
MPESNNGSTPERLAQGIDSVSGWKLQARLIHSDGTLERFCPPVIDHTEL